MLWFQNLISPKVAKLDVITKMDMLPSANSLLLMLESTYHAMCGPEPSMFQLILFH